MGGQIKVPNLDRFVSLTRARRSLILSQPVENRSRIIGLKKQFRATSSSDRMVEEAVLVIPTAEYSIPMKFKRADEETLSRVDVTA